MLHAKTKFMKKISALLLVLSICIISAKAQSYTGETKINKMAKMAIINELPFTADVTEDAVKKKMSQLGYTGKKDNGYMVYKNVSLPEIGTATYNLYFKTERKSRQQKEVSLIYMLITDSYDAFVTEERDAEVISNGKRFLNSFNTPAQDVAIENDIKDQEDNLKKAEKRYNNAVSDGKDLEEKRKKIERDIEDNKKDQEQRRVDVEKQKQVLDAARARRRQ